jgi:hypothetical protein
MASKRYKLYESPLYSQRYRDVEEAATPYLERLAGGNGPLRRVFPGCLNIILEASAYYVLKRSPREGRPTATEGYYALREWLIKDEFLLLIIYRINDQRREVELVSITGSRPIVG